MSNNPVKKPASALSKADILAIDTNPKMVNIEGLGFVYIKMITAGDRVRFQNLIEDTEAQGNLEKLIVLGLCELDGKPLFTKADIPALKKLPFGIFQNILTAILEHNGLSTNALEDVEGN